MGSINRTTVLKFIGFAVGLAAKFTTGSIFVFNAYQDAIKYNFNYTQTEVELLSSMLNVGLGVGFVPGIFYDRFGPTITSAAGLFVSVPIYLLLWSTKHNVHFYSTKAWLMSIYFLLAGFGSVFTYMVSLNTNVINFPAKHTGKVVGFLNAFFAGSPSVFGTLYYKLFTTGDVSDPANQDFYSFMLFFAILFAIVNVLCMIFLRIYTDTVKHENVTIKYIKDTSGTVITDGATIESVTDTGYDSKDKGVNGSHESNGALPLNDSDTGERTTVCKTICSAEFEIFSWMFAFASSVGLVYGNNITVTSKSLHLDYFNDKLVIIIPITNAIVSASIGIISDTFKERVPRVALVTLGCVCFVVAQTIVLAGGNVLTLLVVATVFTGVGVGIIWSLSPTIMKELFSVGHLGRNWGIALLLSALLAFASQTVFGRLYDMNIPEGEGNNCYGKVCIQSGYGLFLGVAALSVALGVLLLIYGRFWKKTE